MLWQSIKQRNPAWCVRVPVSDGSVWLWHQLSFPKESHSSFALGRHSFCIGVIGILTSLFSWQALIAIPSCPDSCWIPATSPQPPEEMERWSWFALLCSFSFYLFLNVFVYCASSLSSALQWASWLESALPFTAGQASCVLLWPLASPPHRTSFSLTFLVCKL